MTEPTPPRMFCFVCRKELQSVWTGGLAMREQAHPSGAVCLEGGPPFGSRFDCDHVEIGFQGYEVFICDDCWEPRRDLVLAFKEHPTPTTREYITGTECQARLDALEAEFKKLKNTPR